MTKTLDAPEVSVPDIVHEEADRLSHVVILPVLLEQEYIVSLFLTDHVVGNLAVTFGNEFMDYRQTIEVSIIEQGIVVLLRLLAIFPFTLLVLFLIGLLPDF